MSKIIVEFMTTEELEKENLLELIKTNNIKNFGFSLELSNLEIWAIVFFKEEFIGYGSIHSVDQDNYAFLVEGYPRNKEECEQKLGISFSQLREVTNFGIYKKLLNVKLMSLILFYKGALYLQEKGIHHSIVTTHSWLRRLFVDFNIKYKFIGNPNIDIHIDNVLRRISERQLTYNLKEEKQFLSHGSPRGIVIDVLSITNSEKIKNFIAR